MIDYHNHMDNCDKEEEEEDVVMECIIAVNNRGDGDNGSKYLMTYVVLSLS